MQAAVRGNESEAATGHLRRQEPGAGGEPKVKEVEGEDEDVQL